ncbi:hypothetical protein [Vagococcus fessus]|uniref:DUF3168 domain-containing protein n=1 Tax=Vagococcus fessus TaxID=120370 RepID=A0A430A577_9ENTE|nr:hypothetical protein [Vagococcus fessus]RSU01965.1 hypothetical protein CBF31_09365 [Vagococcus fessus]
MSLIETDVYHILSDSQELINKMNEFRGHSLDGDNGIFVDEIKETYIKKEYAPFIRINLISEINNNYQDDLSQSEDQRVQVSCWANNSKETEELKNIIDRLLEEHNIEQFYGSRYKDPDINLKMSVRKYRRIDWKSR